MAEIVNTNQFRNGMHIEIDGAVWRIVEFQHVKPGKGPAFVRTKLRNVESGKNVDKTFNAGTKVETANVDKRTMQYLYNDGSSYVFMDNSTYEQLEVSPEVVGDAKNFMLENQEAIVATNDGRVLFIELPASVELLIAETEPGLQGDRSTGGHRERRDAGHEGRAEEHRAGGPAGLLGPASGSRGRVTTLCSGLGHATILHDVRGCDGKRPGEGREVTHPRRVGPSLPTLPEDGWHVSRR